MSLHPSPLPKSAVEEPAVSRKHGGHWRQALRCVALIVAVLGIHLWPRQHPGYGWPFILWALGIVVYPFTYEGARVPFRRLPQSTWLGLVAILAVAAALRFIAIGDIPVDMHNDEITPVLEARGIARGLASNVFSTVGWYNTPNVAFTFVALMLMLLPRDAIFAARLCTALLGMGGIIFTFLLARRLFADRVALIASALMAASFWHVTDSRWALPFIQSPFCTGLVLYLLVRARQDESRAILALAGICAGLALECYFPSRIVLLLCPAFLLMEWVRHRVPVRTALAEGLTFAIPSALVLAPFVLSVPWEEIVERSQRVLLTDPRSRFGLEQVYHVSGVWPVFLRNIQQALSMFTEWAHMCANCPSRTPLLDATTLVALVVGTALVILRGRPKELFLLGWVVFTVLVGVAFTDDPRAAYRLAAAMPAIFMLAALGVEGVFFGTQQLFGTQQRGWYQRLVRPVLFAAVIAFMLFQNYDKLFGHPLPEGVESVALRLVGSHCDGRRFYFVGNWYGPGPLPSQEPPRLELFCQDYTALAPDQIPNGVDIRHDAEFLVIGWADPHALEVLRACYPSAIITPYRSSDDRLLFTALEVSAQAIQNHSCPSTGAAS